jgi:broad specificity phosphatase PhoE
MTRDTHLFLVRHADTVFTEQGLIHGSLDSPLSEAGRRQARQAAERLRGEEFEVLYSSPLGRAMATADIIGQAIGLEPLPVPGLAERDFGWGEGKPMLKRGANKLFRLLSRIMIRTSLLLSGERDQDFKARVDHAIDGILATNRGKPIIIVTHWGVLGMALNHLLGERRTRSLGPISWHACGITELEAEDGRWKVITLNDAGHLAPEGG